MANRRQVQPLLDRPVYASFNVTELKSADYVEVNEAFMKSFDKQWQKIQFLRESIHKAYKAMTHASQGLTNFRLT